ncbi:probable ethanolamine kinase [Zingiber officinale]|uniref:ethanolamine kinase n=1 Tax=Zingiber officinale TaxID=94328 RepID=A0A8J5HDX8_ZINOF|nr:probable ethanolamine kinase [Zingiber officinale]XP_042451641.1 probable ethanolamine kinase [Zingiber officinale]KAG6519792.1 hypothetical protein ZIOFF_023301 [Zingiber officinale]
MGYVKVSDAVASMERGGEDLVDRAAETIPSSPIEIDISLPLDRMKAHIVNLCKDLFLKWSSLDESCFTVETVSGGITNLLLKVSIRENSGNMDYVTVRLYGPNTDLVIDRKRELQALPHLSAAGFGAKLLGIFGNGMVQSFLDARTLSPTDMSIPEIASEIARQLHRFHMVAVPGSTEPQLWNDLLKFLDKAAALKFEDSGKQARYESISFPEIRDEIDKLKDLTTLLNSPVVFAHNDLLSGNLMLNDKEGRLYFIDFEYGSYSYRGYDIANHFNEYAGFDCDYSLYPQKETQYHFFRNYLEPQKPHEVPDDDLEALFVETNTFRLASHIYWALWAIVQAQVSSIDFDYLSYFFLRYNEYKKQRETCISVAREYLSRSAGS